MMRRRVRLAFAALAFPVSPALAGDPVWIDTDAACGLAPWSNVDDCWALAIALRPPATRLRSNSARLRTPR